MSPSAQPYMSRQSYRHELVTVMLLPLAISLVEGSVITVLAKRVFDVGPFAFATMMAAPMFANLTSFMWASAAKGKRKVRFIAGLQGLLLLCLVGIAFLPISAGGAFALVGLTVLSRCCLAGVATLRSTVWRQNYPRRSRARITSKLVLITSLVLALGPLPVYYLLDGNPMRFRWLFVGVAVIGGLGVLSYSRIRLRTERQLLAQERRGRDEDDADGLQRTGFVSVLRNDRFFRHYMTWQFCAGVGNMVGETAIIALIIKWTVVQPTYVPILLNATVPMLMATLTLPMWAKYMDRVHITTFRTRHAFTWILAQFGYWVVGVMVAMGSGMWWLVVLPRIMQGLARSGGLLAWNLGHNDFADKRLVTTYMGIHVTLTGVRGFFASYLAILLLEGWNDLPWVSGLLPKFDGIHHHVFLITTGLCIAAQAGFYSLHRMYKRQQAEADKAEDQVFSDAV
ncbi:Major Facilitator Superfamily protein [Poriferisphaera corsica]|uniref:Major Facilitator Superfamily protein n=2 Tax=Poriferisphaera corsica TaxID=2528020 RepID=A0A517YYS3_9BACT|nr:Major Facilitator Superfamily protein [Poriferisphaera corsica]